MSDFIVGLCAGVCLCIFFAIIGEENCTPMTADQFPEWSEMFDKWDIKVCEDGDQIVFERKS